MPEATQESLLFPEAKTPEEVAFLVSQGNFAAFRIAMRMLTAVVTNAPRFVKMLGIELTLDPCKRLMTDLVQRGYQGESLVQLLSGRAQRAPVYLVTFLSAVKQGYLTEEQLQKLLNEPTDWERAHEDLELLATDKKAKRSGDGCGDDDCPIHGKSGREAMPTSVRSILDRIFGDVEVVDLSSASRPTRTDGPELAGGVRSGPKENPA